MDSKQGIVYSHVAARMAILGTGRREVAQRMGIHAASLRRKLYGLTPFSLEEAIALYRILNMTEPLEAAFVRTQGEERH